MEPIDVQKVQKIIDHFQEHPVYLHLETTQGAYAARDNAQILNAGAYIRNVQIQYHQGKIIGNGPFRVGLKMDFGWVYAEGLTDWETDSKNRLLLAGHDREGRLAVALEISVEPF